MSDQQHSNEPSRDDFQQAIQSLDTYIDITVDDLMELTQRAKLIAKRRATGATNITQVMSKSVRTVHVDTPLKEAAQLMVAERISGLPVVDDDGRMVGLITEADFLRALGVPTQTHAQNIWQTLESLFSHMKHHTELEAPNEPVSMYMVRNVLCVQPEQELHEVLGIMKKHTVKRVVVCDEARRVLGIVTRSDLVRVFFARFA